MVVTTRKIEREVHGRDTASDDHDRDDNHQKRQKQSNP